MEKVILFIKFNLKNKKIDDINYDINSNLNYKLVKLFKLVYRKIILL